MTKAEYYAAYSAARRAARYGELDPSMVAVTASKAQVVAYEVSTDRLPKHLGMGLFGRKEAREYARGIGRNRFLQNPREAMLRAHRGYIRDLKHFYFG